MRFFTSCIFLAALLVVFNAAAEAEDHPGSATIKRFARPATLSSAGEGRRLWLEYNCYGCHGLHGAGQIAVNVQGLGGLVQYYVTGSGVPFGMPNFSSELSSTDITNLANYLNVAGTPAEPIFLEWWLANPTR